MSARAFRTVLAVWLALSASIAFGSARAGFTSRLWQTADGLPEQTIQAFAQTPDHYLWVGTTGGLLRFDGSRFTVFDQEHNPEFRENSVFALLVTRDGCLWIGTEGGGLMRYCQGVFKRYGSAQGLTDGFVRALVQDHKGSLWVGTDDGLFKMAGNRLERMDGRTGFPALAVHAITEDHCGGLWVGGSRLLRLEGDAVRLYRLGGSENRVKSILETSNHTIWVGTVSGLQRLRQGEKEFRAEPEIRTTVRVLRQTSDETFWMGTIGQGLRCWNKDGDSSMVAPASLPSNTVLSVFEDDEQNIWIGTQAGLLRLTRTPVRQIPLPTGVDSDFGTIYADPTGALWVVSADLFRIRGNVAERFALPGLRHVPIRNLFRDRAGVLWVGTDGQGLIRMDGTHPVKMTTRDGLVNNFVRAIMQSRDGTMWIATDEGVSHLTHRGFINYSMQGGLSYFSTRALLEDRRGDIWIGTDRGVSRLHAGAFAHDIITSTLAQEKVWSICEDQEGSIWLGTRNNGLYRWKNGHLSHLTTDSGLSSNSIYQVLEDSSGTMWISGPNDISRIERSALDQAAEDIRRKVAPQVYTVSDEVGPTQIYGGRQPSGCLDANGDPWFASSRGPIHITRETAHLTWNPRLVISDVSLDGIPVKAGSRILMAPGSKRLEIGYSPVLLRSQDRVRFRYWLEGFDPGWMEASTRRIASYTNLPPGRYTFHVAAFESDNPQLASEVSLEIEQKPHFYATTWFGALMVLLVGVIVFGAYRFRLWQIQMRFEAALDERNRVAREMHDTVIQGCASTSALLEALSSINNTGSELARSLMDHARAQIRTTIDEARQAVWDLRQQRPAETRLVPALQQLAERTGSDSAVQVTCEVNGKVYALNQCATHELLMIGREAVNNAVQHAAAEKIDIRVHFGRKRIFLEVRDNGTGFAGSQSRGPHSRHYGLVGMRERAEALGGHFRVESTKGKGTIVTVEIPRKTSVAQTEMSGA